MAGMMRLVHKVLLQQLHIPGPPHQHRLPEAVRAGSRLGPVQYCLVMVTVQIAALTLQNPTSGIQ